MQNLVFQSPDIEQNSDVGISDYRISGQSFTEQNCLNSRISNDIDVKLGSVSKLEKRNTATPKKFDDEIITDQLAIRMPELERIVCKTYIFINSNLSPYQN